MKEFAAYYPGVESPIAPDTKTSDFRKDIFGLAASNGLHAHGGTFSLLSRHHRADRAGLDGGPSAKVDKTK